MLVFAGALGVVRMRGFGVAASTVPLALWVTLLEGAEMFVAGRTPDITEPLLVLLVGALLGHSFLSPARTRAA